VVKLHDWQFTIGRDRIAANRPSVSAKRGRPSNGKTYARSIDNAAVCYSSIRRATRPVVSLRRGCRTRV
jgi:hypothetical protein